MSVHMNRRPGQTSSGARALCGADHRHGVMTTVMTTSTAVHVTCLACRKLLNENGSGAIGNRGTGR